MHPPNDWIHRWIHSNHRFVCGWSCHQIDERRSRWYSMMKQIMEVNIRVHNYMYRTCKVGDFGAKSCSDCGVLVREKKSIGFSQKKTLRKGRAAFHIMQYLFINTKITLHTPNKISWDNVYFRFKEKQAIEAFHQFSSRKKQRQKDIHEFWVQTFPQIMSQKIHSPKRTRSPLEKMMLWKNTKKNTFLWQNSITFQQQKNTKNTQNFGEDWSFGDV